LLELLVTVLELLDGAGELAQRIFETIEPHDQVGLGGLPLRRIAAALLLIAAAFALIAIEQAAEKAVAAVLLGPGGRSARSGQQRASHNSERDRTESETNHGHKSIRPASLRHTIKPAASKL